MAIRLEIASSVRGQILIRSESDALRGINEVSSTLDMEGLTIAKAMAELESHKRAHAVKEREQMDHEPDS